MSDASQPDADDEFPIDVFDDDPDFDLRPGSDSCYKCSTCDTNCPVAEVDDDFPGPKFQGPEQWRLKRKEDRDIDPSVMDCSGPWNFGPGKSSSTSATGQFMSQVEHL